MQVIQLKDNYYDMNSLAMMFLDKDIISNIDCRFKVIGEMFRIFDDIRDGRSIAFIITNELEHVGYFLCNIKDNNHLVVHLGFKRHTDTKMAIRIGEEIVKNKGFKTIEGNIAVNNRSAKIMAHKAGYKAIEMNDKELNFLSDDDEWIPTIKYYKELSD